jgi:hypothetical protein
MAVPYTFGTATAAIPLSQLDSNFATAITLGNTAMYLGNTTTSVGNLTLTNVTISSGTANVTANITYGTANAVVYSNASNVGTTSANLTFNGTTLTSTGFAGPLNGTVGATTANTGAFTTLSASGVATFSAGTVSAPAITTSGDTNTGIYFPAADTIAFTEGGTEAMRINSSGNVLLGTASTSGEKLRVETATNTYLSIIAGTSSVSQLWFGSTADSNIGYIGYDHSSNFMNFRTASTERMRIDSSGNVGIGTSSPAVKLDVAGNATVQNGVLTVGKDTVYDAFINTPESMYFNVDSDANSTGNRFVWGTDRAGNTGGTEWMRLDSSGNLGLGVTPAAWNTSYEGFQVGSTTALWGISSGAGGSFLSNNVVFDTTSARKYLVTGAATEYGQASGAHSWSTAASGTAGNTITFTQAMTLDASGNLGIGTSSPAAPLHVFANSGDMLRLDRNNTGAVGNQIAFRHSNAGTLTETASINAVSTANADTGTLAFYTKPTGGSSTERMRIDTSGNVGINTTSPAGNLQISGSGDRSLLVTGGTSGTVSVQLGDSGAAGQGGMSYDNSVDALFFKSNGSERMRIDSSGNLLVGTTSSSDTTGIGFKVRLNSAGTATTCTHDTSGGFSTYHVYNINATNNGYRFYVNIDGGISNYSGNNINLSDERTKTNIELSGSYLDKICSIPVKLFNYKDEPNGEQRTLGVIAQDVEAVAPELVSNDGFGETKEGEEPLKSIYTTDMMFAMMKAIQELKAEFDAYKASHP